MTTTAVANRPVPSKLDTIKDLLIGQREQLAMAVPKFLTPDRLIRVALNAMASTPALLNCSQNSLLSAVMQCAQLGLEPGILGDAYLIPYGQTVQFIPGYKGLLKLARRTGEISTINAREVYMGDQFDYAYGLEPFLVHKPVGTKDRGKITHFYAAAKLKDGSFQFEVMTIDEVEEHRDKYSKAKANGPWVTNFREMGLKTALRRLCKLLPSSTELQQAVALDEYADRGLPQSLGTLAGLPDEDVVDVEEQAQAAQLQELQAALDAKRAAANGKPAGEPAQEAAIMDPDTTTQESTEESAGIDNSLWTDLNTLWQESHNAQFQACKKTFGVKAIKELPANHRVSFRNTMADLIKAATK